MTNEAKLRTQQSSRLDYLLAKRICRTSNSSLASCEYFVVCAPYSVTSWMELGEVCILSPGIAYETVSTANGTSLIIDERCLLTGPWANTAGSTGEGRLVELESITRHIQNAGGVVVGVHYAAVVPDVNLSRLRKLYGLSIGDSKCTETRREPRLISKIRSILETSAEAVNV